MIISPILIFCEYVSEGYPYLVEFHD